MSNDNPQPFAGMSVQAVADATGLSRATIYQVAEHKQLGAPAHFTYAHGVTIYTPAGLCQLAEGLDALGHTVGARALAARIATERQLAATNARVTTPDSPTVRAEAKRWDIELERRQEEQSA